MIAILAIVWEAGARFGDNSILFPTFLEALDALKAGVTDEGLGRAAAASLAVLVKSYVIAMALALAFSAAAILISPVRDLLSTLTAMFNPLPAIALLPLAMLWFGIGERSLTFVLVHSVVWPLALAIVSGFDAVPQTLRLVGRNLGLSGVRYVGSILVPAALPSIISGMKIGWAFAWRTLIAAELVFGVSAREGGLGWFIFKNRNQLLTDKVFAGLATVIVIGLIVEFGLFRLLESATVRRWGMQR